MNLVDELRAVLGDRGVVVDDEILDSYRRDQAGFVPDGAALAAVFPTSTSQVAEVVRLAGRHRVPVVARGAGSGLAGGANATEGCLQLVLTKMDQILEIDADEQTARVQAGVLNADLSSQAAAHGLWYPPDPASREFSTIGGNLATNAGGLCCVKYGVTRDWVLRLEVVLADGSAVSVGHRTVKGVAGYDLVGLFVGSEGTLGVITEATLRLRREAPPRTTAVASFSRLPDAGDAIAAIMRTTAPAILEILDATTIAAIEQWKRMDLGPAAAALLIAQSDLPGDLGVEEITAIEHACRDAGAELVVATSDPAEADLLLAARRFAFPALERQGHVLLDDVAVPRGRVTAMLQRTAGIAERHGLTIGTFGHAGDGNLHPTIVYDGQDPRASRRAATAFDEIVATALSLGGTVTGEHGIGLLKREHLGRELGPAGLRLQRAIKDALDPRHLLNPGKVLPDEDQT
jgi:glycolate oxidase